MLHENISFTLSGQDNTNLSKLKLNSNNNNNNDLNSLETTTILANKNVHKPNNLTTQMDQLHVKI